jgi:flagellar biosynthesis protein
VKGKPEKRKLASALKFEPERDSAPRVTASGKGEVAKAIIEKAREHGVPIQENPPLAQMLSAIPLGTEILALDSKKK